MNRTDSVTNIFSAALMSAGSIAASVLGSAGVLLWLVIGGPSQGQPPGTYPPAEILRPSATPAESGKLPIKGMMFLDVSENAIYAPGMNYERYLELERGGKNQTRRYVYDTVKIDGRVDGNRAELSVEVRVVVDATGEETIEIPLAMENFHRLGPVEFFSGAENGNKLAVSVDQDSGDYELLASVAQDTVVGFRMQMSARVETDVLHALDFRLPPAATEINLISDSRDVVGVIPNRDDEVIETSTDNTGRSQFKVISSGGRFTLQWGTMDRPVSVPLLEATSGIAMQWNSPQDQLLQNVKMTVRDSRGPISSFKLRLPPGASLRDEPKLITSGQFGQQVELSKPDAADDELFLVTIPKFERRQSIVLEFRLELPSDSPTVKKPLPLQVPVVEEALRNQGTINITTGADYRLRWHQRSYVKNTTSAVEEEAAVDQRSYSFQFIRGAFTLPIWLDATKREFRVSSECDIELQDNYANLAMEIRSVGNGNRSQLLSVDLADWQAPRIENARTGAPLPWYESDDLIEIEVSYTGMEESIPVMIKARRPIQEASTAQADQRIELPVPRIVGSGDRRDPITIQEAIVRLSGKGRRSFVVDLERSVNLERTADSATGSGLERGGNGERASADDPRDADAIRVFAVMPPESAARIVGEMVVRPPRISLENKANVKLIGDQLVTTVTWLIETPVDLEGRLRIAIPEPNQLIAGAGLPEASSDGPTGEDVAAASDSTQNQWSVEVNDRAAKLQPVKTDASDSVESNRDDAEHDEATLLSQTTQYDLVSDALADGKMEVRFIHSETVTFQSETPETLVEIGLPYPLVQDITLRGKVELELLGGESHDITPAEKSLTDQLVFRTLPTKTVPLRISPRAPADSELLTGKIVVRTVISEISQHDQLIASLEGTGEFALELRYPDQTEPYVTLDGERAAFKMVGERLVVRVPSDRQKHLIDVRLWVDRTSGGLFQTIVPLAHVGPGAGQLFWQLTVPSDCHLVWTTPSVGREMQWGFDRWRLIRSPLMTETTLINRIAASQSDLIELSPMPTGNRYLFSSMDDRSFRALVGTRTILWMIVAGVIVFVAAVLTYIPATRNPLSSVVAIVGFAGLLAAAPDAAILVGQVSMLSLVLVIVMLAIRNLVLPTPSRVLTSTREARLDASTQSRRQPPDYRPPSSVAVTHSIGPEDVSKSPNEVAS
ncbi:hypothetical protein Enr13x_63800 [Stieleria neptunia]|uniref:Uncharacterized protein n=1 Tax=Stieleria neptunia TaxID=2527979 RepID=A0A518I029_9BACT|nr:hypothetical protein [Stieleria neptunia]QDV46471.1 hypothetical protein Enr13x_63800 [Stieleria neptunia]